MCEDFYLHHQRLENVLRVKGQGKILGEGTMIQIQLLPSTVGFASIRFQLEMNHDFASFPTRKKGTMGINGTHVSPILSNQ